MQQLEYDKDRAIAAMKPVQYVRDRHILRIDEGNLPLNLQEGFCRWWLFGIWPGSFLTAVIRNDLVGAFAHADIYNRAAMYDIVVWIYNYGDGRALKENANSWAAAGGYFGKLKKEISNEPS